MSTLGPRLVIAGTHSGVGKTTIATGLMAAFAQAGHRVRSAKVGPDFIDPGYHAAATGAAPRNLDPWICGADAMAPLAARASSGGDILIVEGVMGLFDGAVDGTPASTADVARMLDAPVVLVVDGSAMSASVAALVRGYRDHDPSITVAAVILNRVGSEHHRTLLVEALDAIDMPVLGTVGRDDALTWRDRHLGLVPVEERSGEVRASIEAVASSVGRGCDLGALFALATSASSLTAGAVTLPGFVADVRLGVVGGPAFTFLYRDNLEALEATGAELVSFDPLTDESLPEGVDGLLVGGGFPEVFGARLAENEPLLAEVRQALRRGLAVWAECGGLIWLASALDGRAMAGAIGAQATMTDRLTLGYREAEVLAPNPVAPVGSILRGHEFHYSTVVPGGDALTLRSRFAERTEGFATPNLLATYLHQHLGGDPAPAANFVEACARPNQRGPSQT